MITTDGIRATGLYLLEVLRGDTAVRYSRFYNAEEETIDRLAAGALPFVEEPECCGEDDLREEGHVMLDFAAWQLEDLGVVRIRHLDELLIDGEPDFLIELTGNGKRVLADGLTFRFRDPDYSIVAAPASEWLIALVEAGLPGDSITLRDAIEHGTDVVITDDTGNAYGHGTGSFLWAFAVSLWHHARSGNVLPACENEQQQTLWAQMIARTNRPDRPSPHDDNPLWDLPFRLNEQASSATVRHVGRVS